ncbi:MAG: phytanoyl-CoA dioxygenase family protein [Acidimicrobiales bacterium]
MNHRPEVPGLRRPVTEDEVAAFARDGVVHLPAILDLDALDAMGRAVDGLIERGELADLTEMGAGLAAAGEPVLGDDRHGDRDGAPAGRFVSGIDHWLVHDEFAGFACRGPLPAIVAALLRSATVQLWEDSVLVKEPGTREATAWHTDLAYFDVTGHQLCTTWVPLDPASADTGAMRFVAGSHRWAEDFRPNLFVSTTTIPGTEGVEVPDVDAMAAAGEVEVRCFDVAVGDLTVHHARTLHAAGPNRSATTRRRAISVRYCGDDARYHRRPGVPHKPHHATLAEGEPLSPRVCPVVWPPD